LNPCGQRISRIVHTHRGGGSVPRIVELKGLRSIPPG